MGQKEQASALICALSLLISISVILAKCLHQRPKVAAMLPEAGMIILLGVLAGFLATVLAPPSELTDALTSFSPDTFFILLLPPIIFNRYVHIGWKNTVGSLTRFPSLIRLFFLIDAQLAAVATI